MKPKTLTKYYLSIYLSLFNVAIGFSQQPERFKIKEIGTPFINTYLSTDYGAHEQTFQIDQASNGLMYFANVTGIIEFDGQNWNVDSRVSDDSFKDVVVGPDNRIYGVSNRIYGYFESNQHGELIFESLIPKTPGSFQNTGSLTGANLVDNKIVFRSSESLLLYDIERDTISLINAKTRFGNANEIDGKYYVIDADRGLLQLKDDKLEPMPSGAAFLDITVNRMVRFSENQLLVITKNSGLYIYDFNSLKPWNTDVTNFLKTAKGFSGLNIKDQYFGIGTENSGVVIIDRAGRLIQKLDKSTGLGNNGLIQDLFLDQNDNLWVAEHGGIHQVILNSAFTTLDERHGVNGYVLFFQKHDGKTYVGTASGMVVKNDDAPWQKTGEYKVFKPVINSKERVWMFVNHGEDFFALGNGGAHQITKNGVRNLYRGERLWAVVAMKNAEQMVVGSVEGNLHLFEKESGRWRYKFQIKGFHQQMDFLEQTDDGDLWMTDSGSGVFKIKLTASKDSVISIRNYGPDDGLPSQVRNRVFRHREGLMFATANGVYRYDQSSDSFLGMDKFNSHLSEDYVFRLIEMKNGDVYGSLNPRGKALLRKKGDDFDFTQIPLQRISGHNSEYVSDLNTDAIWIAGSGIKIFDPEFRSPQSDNFQSYVRSVRISNQNDSLIYAGGQVKQLIQLNPTENAIHFTYSASFYDKIEEIEYQSYLEGSEETWAAWNSEPDRNYTNLPHGEYTFRVRARNVYGRVSEVAEYRFTIITPWYLTIWAYLLYSVLVALAVWGIVKINARRLVKEKEALEQTVFERTEEIRKQKEKAEQDRELIQQQADRLKELDKVKSRFFANISHELRTPLTLINAPLESLINNGEIENESVRETLKTAQRNGVSLLSLVEEILDLGKLQAGKLELVKNPVRLKEFLTDILNSHQSGLAGRNIQMTFDFQLEERLAILMDENKCGKIIRNLLSNALKFTNNEIVLKVFRNPKDLEHIRISVTDNGIGVHPNDLPFIFDRYYQSEQPGQKAEGGTGIGLALAKELALLHGGNLTVSSKLGDGSTFIFDLPAIEVKEETIVPLAKTDSVELEQALQDTVKRYIDKFKVDKPVLLITEDHPEMRAFIAQTLEPYFGIRQAENGEVALQILRSENIDIVISDVMMPVMDGFELLEEVKKDISLHQISIVMLTARADQEDKLHALTLGIDDYMTKPFSAAEFLARIKNILENRIKIIRQLKILKASEAPQSDLKEFIDDHALSEREIDVMKLLAKRLTYAEMAEALFVSANTVKFHIKNLYTKLGVTSRTEVVEKVKDLMD